MLTSYIHAAMNHAHYELMEGNRLFGSISQCPGLWAEGDTLELCQTELQSTLEDWIVIKLRHGDSFEPIDGADINPKPEYAEAD